MPKGKEESEPIAVALVSARVALCTSDRGDRPRPVGGRYAILNKFSWLGLLPSGEPNGMAAGLAFVTL